MPRKPKSPSEKNASNSFLEALQFIGSVTKDVGAPFETHVNLKDGIASAFNGVIAAGQNIEEDIFACPHNTTLITALSKCGEAYTITQLDNGRLAVKAGRFKAMVPCIDPTTLQQGFPDLPQAVIDDRFKVALEAISGIKVENGQRVVTLSFLMTGSTVIATDGKIIFEFWHGIDLPPNIAIPKALIGPILKTNKKLARFGVSTSSVTFYFEDNSWIKSQLYAEPWPNIDKILDKKTNAQAIPPDFFKGLEAISPFSEGNIYFYTDKLKTHFGDKDEDGASYEVPGLNKGPIFSAKYLHMIKPYAETIDFYVEGPHKNSNMLMFYGKNIRGGIMGHG